MAALNNRDSARIKHGQKEYKLNEVNIFNIFQGKLSIFAYMLIFCVYRIQINKFKKRHTVRLFFIARYPLDTKKYNIQQLHKLRIAAIARNTTTSRVSFIYLFFAFLCFFSECVVVVFVENTQQHHYIFIILMDVRTQMVSAQRLMGIQYTIFQIFRILILFQ